MSGNMSCLAIKRKLQTGDSLKKNLRIFQEQNLGLWLNEQTCCQAKFYYIAEIRLHSDRKLSLVYITSYFVTGVRYITL